MKSVEEYVEENLCDILLGKDFLKRKQRTIKEKTLMNWVSSKFLKTCSSECQKEKATEKIISKHIADKWLL